MTDPFAYHDFQGIPNLPHYMMSGYSIEIPSNARPEQYQAEITLRFLVEGPEPLVAVTALTAGAARTLASQMLQNVDESIQLWDAPLPT